MEKTKNRPLVCASLEKAVGRHSYDTEELEVQQVGKSDQPDGQRPQVRSCQHNPKIHAGQNSTEEGLGVEAEDAPGHEFRVL